MELGRLIAGFDLGTAADGPTAGGGSGGAAGLSAAPTFSDMLGNAPVFDASEWIAVWIMLSLSVRGGP